MNQKDKTTAPGTWFTRIPTFGQWAALLPQLFGVATVAGYYVSRDNLFPIVAIYGGFACLGLVIAGLVAIIFYRIRIRHWTMKSGAALLLLLIAFPSSLVYAVGILGILTSIEVTIFNSRDVPLTHVGIRIKDKEWRHPDVPPHSIRRKLLFFAEDSDSSVNLRGLSGDSGIDKTQNSEPTVSGTKVLFKVDTFGR